MPCSRSTLGRMLRLILAIVLETPATAVAVTYATYLDPGWEATAGVADSNGNLYVGGMYFASAPPGCEASVVKINPSGSGLLWSACFNLDSVTGMGIDSAGFIYALTYSAAGNVSTVFKLSPDQGQILSTMQIPGARASSMALDSAGNIYVAGQATALQTTPRAYLASGGGGFAAKLNSTGAIQYATYVGSTFAANAIAVDSAGQSWIAGDVGTVGRGSAIGVLKLDAAASNVLVQKQYGGGAQPLLGPCCVYFYDSALSVAVDGSDAAWVVGYAESGDVPTTAGVQFGSLGSGGSGFAIKFSSSGEVLYATYVSDAGKVSSVTVDAQGDAYLAWSGTLFEVSPDGSTLLASPDLGCGQPTSTSLDGKGGFYASGNSAPTAFFATPGAYVQLYPFGKAISACAEKLDFTKPAGPQVSAVVNAGSAKVGNNSYGVDGSVAAGEIVSIFGSGFAADTQVTFDGVNAPILYTGATQINAVVPFETAGPVTALILAAPGGSAASLALPVAPAMPGLFMSPPAAYPPSLAASAQAAALNQDGSINSTSNPAPAGSVISVFLTGAGQLLPELGDGQLGPLQPPYPAPVLGVSADLCSIIPGASTSCASAPVLFAGQAPGLIAGVLQVNLLIPHAAGNTLIVYIGDYATWPAVVAIE